MGSSVLNARARIAFDMMKCSPKRTCKFHNREVLIDLGNLITFSSNVWDVLYSVIGSYRKEGRERGRKEGRREGREKERRREAKREKKRRKKRRK